MEVLTIILCICGFFLLKKVLNKFDVYLQSNYQHSVYDIYSIVFILASQITFILGVYGFDEWSRDNSFILFVITIVLFIAVLYNNIKNTTILCGILLTIVQFLIGFIILVVILVFLSVFMKDDEKKY